GGALVMLSREALSLESLAALSARERRLVLAALALAALMLVFGVLIPLDRSVAHAHDRLASKRADLSWMQSVAPELASSPAQPAATGESLLVIVDRSAREAGLAGSLTSEPAGPGALSVRLQRAPFDSLVAWLGRLAQQNGAHVDSAPVGDFSWELYPMRLLYGRLAGHVAATRAANTLSADVELGLGQRATLRHVKADLALDPALIPGLPATLHGRATLDLEVVRIEH